jgi:ketosteroid isomerase-like protein
MTHVQHSSPVLAALLVVAATAMTVPGSVQAQVPKEPCCLNNFRFAGTCQVTPRQGQLCQNILDYLNNFQSSGEAYCGSTPIRGGWTLVNCDSGDPAGRVGTTTMAPVQAREPVAAPVITPSRGRRSGSGASTATAVDAGQLQVTDANVIQVRLEQPLDGDALTAGQLLTGTLEADVVGPDGSVMFPAGAKISTRVDDRQGWSGSTGSGVELHMVSATTGAAGLFGAGSDPALDSADGGASLTLNGDLVELAEGSVVTFQVDDVSDQPADSRVLDVATDVWMDAFNARDAVTIAGLASDTGALLPPEGRAVIGRDAIHDYWKQRLATATTRLELVNVETVIQGDLGYKAGRFELTDADSGETVDVGKYLQIWKRGPGGYWELHRDIWNSNLGGGG